MEVHNYATTTIENRRRYLDYFVSFATSEGIDDPAEVTYELVAAYQEALHAHRKADGAPLAIATQVQRLIPITQLFAWLRRQHRIDLNPTADLLMPRADRQLPEATGTAQTSVDTVSDISGCQVALTGRERELVFDRGEPTEDALAPAAIVGVLDPHDDGAVELVAALPALLVEHVLL